MVGRLKFLFGSMTIGLIFLLVSCAAAGAVPARGGGWPMHLRLLGGPSGGQWSLMGEPIAEILSERVLPTTSRPGGGVANIEKINSKGADLAFTLNCFIGASRSGEAEYGDIKLENVSILANIYPQVLYFLIRRDYAKEYGITDVESLLKRGEKVNFASLKPGTASHFILGMLLKYGYNTGFDQLAERGWNVAFNDYAETADDLVAGDLDCFAYTAGVDVPLIHTIEDQVDLQILPLSREVLDALSAKFSTGKFTIASGAFKGVKEPVLTLGDYACLITRKDFPDDLIYTISKAIWEERKSVEGAVADFTALSPDTASPTGFPVHPGASAFWKELREAK